MKRFAASLITLCAMATLTILLASSVAVACLTSIQASDNRGGFFCQLTSSDANWCYYECDEEGEVEHLYAQFGLEAY